MNNKLKGLNGYDILRNVCDRMNNPKMDDVLYLTYNGFITEHIYFVRIKNYVTIRVPFDASNIRMDIVETVITIYDETNTITSKAHEYVLENPKGCCNIHMFTDLNDTELGKFIIEKIRDLELETVSEFFINHIEIDTDCPLIKAASLVMRLHVSHELNPMKQISKMIRRSLIQFFLAHEENEVVAELLSTADPEKTDGISEKMMLE